MFVLDASALVKLVLDETGSAEFRAWYREHASDRLLGPYLLWSEVARAIQKERAGLDAAEAAELHRLLVANVEFHAVTEPELWAATAGLTVYDAHYLALAKAKGVALVTADEAIKKAAKQVGVGVVGV